MKGILGEKVGMTQIFDEESRMIPVTVVRVGGCRIQQVRTVERDGYRAVQLALGEKRRRKANKPERGNAQKSGIEVPRSVVEIRVGEAESYEPGQAVTPDIFAAGEKVDVIGVSKGKGFAGVMKRHNFHGMKASHGAHRVHRHPGSIGMCATPARVLKGTRMAGQMGHRRTTVQNLTVVQADTERDLILVRGAVPGPRGGLVMIREAVKRPLKKGGRP